MKKSIIKIKSFNLPIYNKYKAGIIKKRYLINSDGLKKLVTLT